MTVCPHMETEPVYAYLHHATPKVGDQVLVANDGQPVARICVDCHAALPVNWGCPDCRWIETRRLCDVVPTLLPGQPCDTHRRTA